MKILITSSKEGTHTFYKLLVKSDNANKYLFLPADKKKNVALPSILQKIPIDILFLKLFYLKRIVWKSILNELKFRFLRKDFFFSEFPNHLKMSSEYNNSDIVFVNHESNILTGIDKPFVKEIEYLISKSCMDVFLTKGTAKKAFNILLNKYSNTDLKYIICYYDVVKKSLISNGANKIADKIVVVPPAYPKSIELHQKPIHKDGFLNVLFIGSINYNLTMYERGILDLIEVMKRLSDDSRMRFFIRIKPTKYISKLLKQVPSNRYVVLDKYLSNEELKELFINSDVLFLPARVSLYVSFVEAFSFGMPIITLDKQANREFVTHNKTGFIIKRGKRTVDFAGLKDAIYDIKLDVPDNQLINQYLYFLNKLKDDKDGLRSMQKNCLREIDTGKFSVSKRNAKLTEIYKNSLN